MTNQILTDNTFIFQRLSQKHKILLLCFDQKFEHLRMNSPIEDIKRAVAENRTGDALSKLLELSKANQQLHNDLHQVFGDFNDLNSKVLRGTIDISEANRLRNIIHEKILFAALNAFDSSGKVVQGEVNKVVGGQNAAFLRKWGFVSLAIGIGSSIIAAFFRLLEGSDSIFLAYFAIFAYLSGILALILLGGWLISIFFKALQGK